MREKTRRTTKQKHTYKDKDIQRNNDKMKQRCKQKDTKNTRIQRYKDTMK